MEHTQAQLAKFEDNAELLRIQKEMKEQAELVEQEKALESRNQTIMTMKLKEEKAKVCGVCVSLSTSCFRL